MSTGSTRAICQSERMKNAPLSSIRNIIAYSDKLEQEGRSIIHLELGEPDFGTPAHIIDACKKALDNQEVHYGPIAGTVELRKALSRHCTRYGLEYAPEEILVSTGVVHGVFLSMLAYLDPGDEILVPDPGYLIYFADPHIAQAKPVSYPLREENGFQLDAETLEALITPRTKAILICSPANPCGSVLDQASLDTVAELAIRHNLLVLSDEIYADMTYDRPMPPSIASLPGMRERTIVLNGFSKYYAMTGWRIGYMLCPVKLMDPIMRLSFYNIACPTTFIQSAGIAALEGDEGPSKAMLAEYRRRRDFMVEALNAMPGCRCRKPDGAFYIFVNIDGTGMDSDGFCRTMIDEAGVSMTPGHVFGTMGDGFVRVSYANSMENLQRSVILMREVLEKRAAR